MASPKKPAKGARKPAARKPAARKAPARKPAARKAAPPKPAPPKPAARKKAPAKKTATSIPIGRGPVRKPPPRTRPAPVEHTSFFGEVPPGAATHDEPAASTEAPPVSPFQPGFAPECMACPIGLVFYALKNTKPEVMEHVMKAGFEMFQAVRALTEQYNERWEQAQKLERIPIS
jgi:hypothetical protein